MAAVVLATTAWIPAARAQDSASLTNLQDRVSYAIGMQIGTSLRQSGYEVNLDLLLNTIRDAMASKPMKLTDKEGQDAITQYREQRMKELAVKNAKESEAFLAENRKKPGVKTKSITLADGTVAEIQYLVLTNGSGEIPKSNDTVVVNYRGDLVNGTEFDSTYKRGHPATFPANRGCRGLSEALQMMPVGSKWQVVIPPSLGYGERGVATVLPNSVLIYNDLELIKIDNPKPVTSDIIRVPSADELKAGAKIEVIKADELEKKAATNQVKSAK